MYSVAEPARRQPCRADGRLSARCAAALAARPVVLVRLRADDRELARAAGIDPLEFRRKNIGDQRWLGVLNAAAEAAGLSAGLPRSAPSTGDVVTGRGIGLGTHHVSYGAAVAEIEVNKRTGEIVAKRLYGALDAGLVVNPALVENQIVGQMVQATSRVLKEEVIFDKSNVTSLDWVSYPVLRFAEHPDVVPVVVQRLEEPSTGAGEEVMGATAAAIANAFFDATGARLQQYPMTPPRASRLSLEKRSPGWRRVYQLGFCHASISHQREMRQRPKGRPREHDGSGRHLVVGSNCL